MKTDFVWKVFRVQGHLLEEKLNELTRDQYEVVTIAYTEGDWTVITRVSGHAHPKGKVIGFSAERE